MTIKLTDKECDLLQTILCGVHEDSDWEYREGSEMYKSYPILVNENEFDIEIINKIYYKLF
jgi:hypothetical protein